MSLILGILVCNTFIKEMGWQEEVKHSSQCLGLNILYVASGKSSCRKSTIFSWWIEQYILSHVVGGRHSDQWQGLGYWYSTQRPKEMTSLEIFLFVYILHTPAQERIEHRLIIKIKRHTR